MCDFALYHLNRYAFIKGNIYDLKKNEILTTVMSDFELSGLFWERDKEEITEMTEDYKIKLFQVKLCYDNLLALTEKLTKWLENPFDFCEELSGIEYQSFCIEFYDNKNPNDNDPYKPFVIINYSGGHLNRIECEYKTDQSCINQFNIELIHALKRVSRNS